MNCTLVFLRTECLQRCPGCFFTTGLNFPHYAGTKDPLPPVWILQHLDSSAGNVLSYRGQPMQFLQRRGVVVLPVNR